MKNGYIVAQPAPSGALYAVSKDESNGIMLQKIDGWDEENVVLEDIARKDVQTVIDVLSAVLALPSKESKKTKAGAA